MPFRGRRGTNALRCFSQSEAPIPRILINYRRADTAGHAGHLYETLAARFGEDAVFMDIAGIAIGEDFVATIEREVAESDAMAVLIGREWTTAVDESGRRRLDAPDDYVVLEIAAALERGIPVIPVLVEGARMPTSAELPARLAPLARRNALELSDARWRYDTGLLIARIESLAPVPAPTPPPPAPAAPGVAKRPPAAWIVGALAVVAAVIVILIVAFGGGDDGGGADGDEPLVATPDSIEFGSVVVGERGDSRQITVTNQGDAAFTINSFGWDPAGQSDFIRDDRECIGVDIEPAGGSCTVFVRFTPSDVGDREASLVVLRAGSEVSARRVLLQGRGEPAADAPTEEPSTTEPTVTTDTTPLPTDGSTVTAP